MLTTREAGEESRLNRKIAEDESNMGMQITSSEAMKEADRKSAEGIHAADRDSKERLAKEELAMKGKYYDAMAKYYGDRGMTALGKAGSGESGQDRMRKEYLESISKSRLELLAKRYELATPEEKADIQQEIEQVTSEARRIANVEAPPKPKPIVDPDIVDPFAVTGGR
ncbi:MAG TPA: hypothetical protein VN638_07765 [Nitrospiraceae bacterium]|nr:hypothetical protein [Nitrospiraceae bacterium]